MTQGKKRYTNRLAKTPKQVVALVAEAVVEIKDVILDAAGDLGEIVADVVEETLECIPKESNTEVVDGLEGGDDKDAPTPEADTEAPEKPVEAQETPEPTQDTPEAEEVKAEAPKPKPKKTVKKTTKKKD